MAIQSPIVLASGFFSQLFPGDTVPGTDTTRVPISGGYMTGQLFAASGVVVSGTLSRNGFNVVTVGDVETVTSTMIASGTIIDADVNISGAINATKLNFLQAGASAVARTVDSKLKDTVSVKDFGAVGDGVADDRAAIQAAIDSVLPRGTVYFPEGVYLISDTLNINASSGLGLIELLGAGGLGQASILKGAAGLSNKTLLYFIGSTCAVRNLSLEAGLATTATAIEFTGDNNNGYEAVADCFFGGWFSAITARTDAYKITDCWALNCTNFFIGANWAMNGYIEGCNTLGGSTSVWLTKNLSSLTPQQAEGVRILNNTFLNTANGAVPIKIETALEIYIGANIIDQTGTNGTGIQIVPVQAGSACAYIKIVDNWIDGGSGAGGACIDAYGAALPVEHIWIERNTFVTTGGLKSAIVLNTVNTYWVVDNGLLSASTADVILTSGSSNGHIFGNRSRVTSSLPFELNTVRTGIKVPSYAGLNVGKTDGTIPATFGADYTTGLVPTWEARYGDLTDFHKLRLTYNNSGSGSGFHNAYGYSLVLEHGGALGAAGGLAIGTGNANAGPLRFVVQGTERGLVNTSGDWLFGTQAYINIGSGSQDGVSLSPVGNIAISRDNEAALGLRRRSSDGGVVNFTRDTTVVGSISVTTTGTAFNTTSDYRAKENVVSLLNATERLQQIPVYRFNFITDPDKVVDGFLAHEVAEIVPEAISGEKDTTEDIGTLCEWDDTVLEEGVLCPKSLEWEEEVEGDDGQISFVPRTRRWEKTGERPVYQGIDQAKLVPLLAAAVQEAAKAIAELKAEVAALKGS